MDTRIYGPGDFALGTHAPRRLPRAGAAPMPDGRTNVSTIALSSGNAAIAPVGATPVVKFTYTVPLLRRAQLQNIFAEVRRATAAAPVGDYGIIIGLKRKTDTVATALIRATSIDNTVAIRISERCPYLVDMLEGDTLTGSLYDSSTGGTVNFDFHAQGIEYDAIYNVTSAYAQASQAGIMGGAGSPIGAPSGGSVSSGQHFVFGVSGGGTYQPGTGWQPGLLF